MHPGNRECILHRDDAFCIRSRDRRWGKRPSVRVRFPRSWQDATGTGTSRRGWQEYCWKNRTMENNEILDRDENRDPLTGEPGSHPVGTGVGTLGGAAAGAALGSLGGPVGTAVGGFVGAIAGAVAGHNVAEGYDPTAEDAYWEENHRLKPYYISDYDYNDYRPAYRMGYEGFQRQESRSYEEAESQLARQWEERRGGSRLTWESAREAVRDGWHHVERKLPGDADGDGR